MLKNQKQISIIQNGWGVVKGERKEKEMTEVNAKDIFHI